MPESQEQNEIKIKKRSLILNTKLIGFLIIIFIFTLSFYYFVVTNSLTASGFLINDNKEKLDSLQKENQELELKVMNMESYYNISERLEELKMVQVDKIDYIEVVEEDLAMK